MLGTQRADFLAGTESSDRIVARAGNDRIAVEYDGGVDRVSCGAGQDTVVADARDRVESDCEIVSRRIHRDRHANPDSQHESEVEPDSLTVGQTTVAVFQVGRNRSGGAASIGFSTSKDGGRTWREGTLPGLTANTTPRGPSARASDPVVAYDAAHGVWLANTLAIAPDATRLTIHRSTDGLSWSGPIDAALSRTANLAYDKNWLTCDNGAASPFRGRCYLAYTLVGEREDDVALQHSDDGGRTWSPAVTRRIAVTGVIPVVQPDGKLVLDVLVRPYRNGRDHLDRRRRQPRAPGDDLRSARQGREAAARAAADRGRRRQRGACRGRLAGLPLQRRLRAERRRALALGRRHDLVATDAGDVGPRRGHADAGRRARHRADRDRLLRDPAERDRRGARHLRRRGRWSAPRRLNPRRMPLEWMPQTTLGRMLADYIGVSWSRGRPLVVYVSRHRRGTGSSTRQPAATTPEPSNRLLLGGY